MDHRIDAGERERQRFEHLVLERPRPRPEQSATTGQRRKGKRAKTAFAQRSPVLLAPGIEERVQLRERWSHKRHGTPETLEHALGAQLRPGSLARLHASGAIDADQLAAAEEIAEAHRALTAPVAVRTASLETRVDGGGRDAANEGFARVRRELAYGRWRASVVGPVEALLAMIVDDIGLTIVAQRHGMGVRRARKLLGDALDLWWAGRARRRPIPAG